MAEFVCPFDRFRERGFLEHEIKTKTHNIKLIAGGENVFRLYGIPCELEVVVKGLGSDREDEYAVECKRCGLNIRYDITLLSEEKTE